ncbi:g5552 [Coccomyxa viridis]|uniref:G5552 protein n=1 Tax=Coccomyxa viridis TaxID=1274662 RepID=A0ABP1FUH2_9CHLO
MARRDPGTHGVISRACHVAAKKNMGLFGGNIYRLLLCAFFPGLPFLTVETDRVEDSEMVRAFMLVKQQIRVHKHIASVQKLSRPSYIKTMLDSYRGYRIDRKYLKYFCEAFCKAADDKIVDVAMAKRMHISMGVKTALRKYWQEDSFAVLLDSLTTACAVNAGSSPVARAISQAVPGVQEALSRLHRWPEGIEDSRTWVTNTFHVICSITAQHASDARDQGIPPEEHLRSVIADPGLQEAESELLVASSIISGQLRSGKRGQLTVARAKPEGASAHGNGSAAEACTPSQQGDDRAAEVAASEAEGNESKRSANQASQRVSVQEQQEAAVPQSSLSEAEKAERRKAKKARQRAARAQVAAQTAEVGLLRRVLQRMLQTPALTENSPEMLLGAVKDAAQHHAEVAHSSGRCLRAHLEACADLNEDGRDVGHEIKMHLIEILVDCVGANLSEDAASQEPQVLERWGALAIQAPDVAGVLKSAFTVFVTMTRAAFAALRNILPEEVSSMSDAEDVSVYVRLSSFASPGRELVRDSALLHAAKVVRLQIQVHKHIASIADRPFGLYVTEMIEYYGIDTGEHVAQDLYEAICSAADSIDVDTAMVKRMHISMGIKAAMRWHKTVDSFSALLDELGSICAENPVSSQIVKAIRQAVPGILEYLFRLHKWPSGLERKDGKWLMHALHLLSNRLTQHAREALGLGIAPEDHVRSICAVPGLPDTDSDLLVRVFQKFWDARKPGNEAPGNDSVTQSPDRASSARPNDPPAFGSTDAGDESSGAKSRAAVAQGSPSLSVKRTPARGARPQQQQPPRSPAMSAADQRKPAENVQGAVEPLSGLSETEKAKRRKAKKARQRAAQAQAAARPAEASEVGSKEPVEDSLGRASKGEQSAEEQAAEWAPQTDKDIDSPMFPAPVSPSTPRENSDSREVAASSRSSSLSSHLSLRQHNGMATQQQELSPPILAAPAAQASALAVQEEEQPWQEVRTSRRRPVRQHAASRAGANEPPRQGRSAPDLEAAAQSASWPRILQAAAQPAEQASMSSDRAVVPPHAQLGQGSAEWLPEWLAAISGSQPQRPPQQNGLDTLQPSGSHDASSSSVQPENSQALPDSTAPDEPCMITQQMPQPGLQFESFSPEQAASNPEMVEEDEETLCVVCMDKLWEVIFYNCMHMVTCQGCAREIMTAGGLCLMCRANIQSTFTARF